MTLEISQKMIEWFLGAFGVTIITFVWTIIQTPRRLNAIDKRLKEQSELFKRRIFPRLRRIEDLLIEAAIRDLKDGEELSGLVSEIRANQYDEADERDRHLDNA